MMGEGVVAAIEQLLGSPTRVALSDRLEGDLQLESLDLALLADQLRERYGVDLCAHLATLELDQLIALTVADVVELVAGVPR